MPPRKSRTASKGNRPPGSRPPTRKAKTSSSAKPSESSSCSSVALLSGSELALLTNDEQQYLAVLQKTDLVAEQKSPRDLPSFAVRGNDQGLFGVAVSQNGLSRALGRLFALGGLGERPTLRRRNVGPVWRTGRPSVSCRREGKVEEQLSPHCHSFAMAERKICFGDSAS